MLVIGNIKSINGLIVDVLTTVVDKPLINTVLYLDEFPEVMLQIIGYSDKNIARCLNLSGSSKVYKGAKIFSSEKGLSIPVGDEASRRASEGSKSPRVDQWRIAGVGASEHLSAGNTSRSESPEGVVLDGHA